jgi:arabinogalactan oligomer/maltooligosaccharide transport system permease protein
MNTQRQWWRHVVGVLAVAFVLLPVVYVVGAAFSASGDTTQLIPRHLSGHNFSTLLSNSNYPFLRWCLNTLIVGGCSVVISVGCAALAAYALSRLQFRGRHGSMLAVLLIQMFPGLLLVVAFFLFLVTVKKVVPFFGIGGYPGLILIYCGTIVGGTTWLIKGYLDSVPRELDDAALIDGCTPMVLFVRILLPLIRPILVVAGFMAFIVSINDFVVASVVLRDKDHWTLAVGLYQFVNDKFSQSWGPFAAGALLAAIPVIVIFQFLQRYLVAGLTQGGVRG